MVNRMLTAFVLVALFSHSISEQENFMVCKNIRNVFTDAEDSRSRIQVDRAQGPPGKKGAPGARGLPGIPGRRGAPAKVNYDQISAMIEERVREGLKKVDANFEALRSDLTYQYNDSRGQRCKKNSGFFYNGKCYFSTNLARHAKINHTEATRICHIEKSVIAEIHSQNQQQAFHNFFRPRIPSPRKSIYLWLGMEYQSSDRRLTFRSEKNVSIDNFKWQSGYPKSGSDRILLAIRSDSLSRHEGLQNRPANYNAYGVICEF